MDKYRGINKLPVLEARVLHLLGRLHTNTSIGSFNTQQELISAFADISRRITERHDKPIYDLPKFYAGTPVNSDALNLFLLGVYSEIEYLLNAAKLSGEMAEENFNFGVASVRRLQAELKYIKRQLSVYSLYTTKFGDNLYFGDTFNNERNIDRGSQFLKEDECFIDLAEGTISLPLLKEVEAREIDNITVGASSNGVLGNNVEAKVPVRGNIKSMFDQNVDTWTEYERVVFSEDSNGLKLHLKIALKETQVVNGIRIHPVFLGARTPLVIEKIQLSGDGLQWINLKNEVSVAGFMDEDNEDRYHLAPHASKFSGEFNITFAPRFTKFVWVLVRQTSAFPIFDVNKVRRLRYAIGIKEIEVYGRRYASAGELISTNIPFEKDINLAGIEALVDPPALPEEVGGASFFLSYDDGASWNELGTISGASVELPEVLTIPEGGISSLRYKMRLFKDENVFAERADTIVPLPFNEIHPLPDKRPSDLSLKYKPEKGSLSVCSPQIVARGWKYPKFPIGNGVYSDLRWDTSETAWVRHGNTELRLRVPLTGFTGESDFYTYVGNVPWTRVDKSTSIASLYDEAYYLEQLEDGSWEVVFGNGSASSPKGSIPTTSDEISIVFDREVKPLKGVAAPYTIDLDYPCDGVKENVELEFIGERRTAREILPNGKRKFPLRHKNIVTTGIAFGAVSIEIVSFSGEHLGYARGPISDGESEPFGKTGGGSWKAFVDGSTELTEDGDWSIDGEEGIIYSYGSTDAYKKYMVQYSYTENTTLGSDDWDFEDGSLQTLRVYDSGYRAVEASTSVTADAAFIQLTDSGSNVQGVVSKSVRLPDGILGSYAPFEVPYINGLDEFTSAAEIQEEDVPEVSSTPKGGGLHIAKFRVTHWQNILSSGGIIFPNTSPDADSFHLDGQQTFENGSTELTGDLQWSVDFTGDGPDGKGYVYLCKDESFTSSDEVPYIAYSYSDGYALERLRGAYSVNLEDGIVHFSEVTSDVSGEIKFKYGSYGVRYNVSQQLEDGKEYKVSYDNGVVSILSGAKALGKNLGISYRYKPEVASALDLAPFFSPLVRAISIRTA